LDLPPNARLFSYRRRFGGVNFFSTSGLVETSPETRSLSRWPPTLSGMAGQATHELRTSTKIISRVIEQRQEGKQTIPVRLFWRFAQNRNQGARDFTRADDVAGIERNGRDALVPPATVFFRERGQILAGGRQIPRIGSQGNFGARSGRAYADRIDALRMQQIRNEFVVAFKVQIADVKENHAIARLDAFAKNLN